MRQYTVNGLSGVLTGVAAGGVLFCWRNPMAGYNTHKWLIELRVEYRTIAGFTAQQEMALAAHHVSGFGSGSGSYTGGTDLALATTLAYDSDDVALSSLSGTDGVSAAVLAGDIKIADAAALTAVGSTVVVAQPFAWDAFAELATGAGVQKGLLQLKYRPVKPKPYGANAGFLVRMPIAMGAAGTGRMHVRATWKEQQY